MPALVLALSLAFSTPARGREGKFVEGETLKRRLNASSCIASSKNAQPISVSGRFSWCYGLRRNISAGLWRKATRVQVSAVAEEEGGRILLSDVVVKQKRKPFLLEVRKWSLADIGTAGTVFGMHALCLLAPFTFTWKAFGAFAVLYVVTGLLGITLSYHRNLSHRSFRLPKWLEYLFAYCGAQAMQGDPLDWVSTHRYHHQYCDSVKDPHSPNEGFWFSHMSWMFDEKTVFDRAVRIVWVYHITWLVNSAAHVWGYQAWNTGDLSRNNWWVAALAFGEGWHNNHHAFQYSARHGLEWWQVDPTWYVIKILEAVGLAKDVRAPLEQHKEKLSFKPGL